MCRRPEWTQGYWLPDYSYHYELPEASLEILAVDQNAVDLGGVGGDFTGQTMLSKACEPVDWHGFLKNMKKDGEDMVKFRAQNTAAKTVLLISHYQPDERYDQVGGPKYLRKLFEQHNKRSELVLVCSMRLEDLTC